MAAAGLSFPNACLVVAVRNTSPACSKLHGTAFWMSHVVASSTVMNSIGERIES